MDNDTKKMFELVLNKLDKMDTRLDKMDTRLDNMDSRQDEIYQVVKAIEHSNQVHRAELDNVKFRTSYLEGTINDIGGVINSRKAI